MTAALKTHRGLAAALAVSVLLAACGGSAAEPTDLEGSAPPAATDVPDPSGTAGATGTAAPTASPTGAPTPTPSATFARTLQRYTGTWTLESFAWDSDDPMVAVGDTVPGSIEIVCNFPGTCGVLWEGQGVGGFSGPVPVVAEGQLSGSTDRALDDSNRCPGTPQVWTTTVDVTYSATEATATVASVTVPRTCETSTGPLWSLDTTWSFVGTAD